MPSISRRNEATGPRRPTRRNQAPVTQVSGTAVVASSRAATMAAFMMRYNPTAISQRICDSIDQIDEHLKPKLYALLDRESFSEENIRDILTEYVGSEQWQHHLALWRQLGIHEQTNQNEPLLNNHVNIYLERNEEGKIQGLRAAFKSMLQGNTGSHLDATAIFQNLDYYHRAGIGHARLNELIHACDELENDLLMEPNQDERSEVLERFNQSWSPTLTATHTIEGNTESILDVKFSDGTPFYRKKQTHSLGIYGPQNSRMRQ